MIDFASLPTMISDAWRRRRGQQARDREDLMRLKERRTLHKPGKAHSTNRERSYHERTKAARTSHGVAQRLDKVRAYRAAVRAYWAGERDTHPEKDF